MGLLCKKGHRNRLDLRSAQALASACCPRLSADGPAIGSRIPELQRRRWSGHRGDALNSRCQRARYWFSRAHQLVLIRRDPTYCALTGQACNRWPFGLDACPRNPYPLSPAFWRCAIAARPGSTRRIFVSPTGRRLRRTTRARNAADTTVPPSLDAWPGDGGPGRALPTQAFARLARPGRAFGPAVTGHAAGPAFYRSPLTH